MKHLYLLLALVQLASCAPAHVPHTAQAPPRARRAYRQAERHHSRERRRHFPQPSSLPWN